MKNQFILLTAFTVLALTAVGCISTVSGNRTGTFWFNSDRVEARYERPIDQVFTAAKSVLAHNGTLTLDGSASGQTNAVRVLEGQVKQHPVWIRVEGLDARLTEIKVQARTSKNMGVADLDLAHEIDKEIALQLTR